MCCFFNLSDAVGLKDKLHPRVTPALVPALREGERGDLAGAEAAAASTVL